MDQSQMARVYTCHVPPYIFPSLLEQSSIGGNALTAFSTLARERANATNQDDTSFFCCMWCHVRFYLRIKLGTMVAVELPSTTIDDANALSFSLRHCWATDVMWFEYGRK
jgi:hypothetical protein